MKRNLLILCFCVFLIAFTSVLSACSSDLISSFVPNKAQTKENQERDFTNPPFGSAISFLIPGGDYKTQEDLEERAMRYMGFCLGYVEEKEGDYLWKIEKPNYEKRFEEFVHYNNTEDESCRNAAIAYGYIEFEKKLLSMLRLKKAEKSSEMELAEIIKAGPDKAKAMALNCLGYKEDANGNFPRLTDGGYRDLLLNDAANECQNAITAMIYLNLEAEHALNGSAPYKPKK